MFKLIPGMIIMVESSAIDKFSISLGLSRCSFASQSSLAVSTESATGEDFMLTSSCARSLAKILIGVVLVLGRIIMPS
jgi:hypothetical protein